MSTRLMRKAAEQQQLYYRLQRAGCQLDYDNLPQVSAPFRVFCTPWAWPTHAFPMGTSTAVIIPVCIVALQTRIVRHFRLSSRLSTRQTGSCLFPCPQNHSITCFREADGAHHHLKLERVLNSFLRESARPAEAGAVSSFYMPLKRGRFEEGCFAVNFAPALPYRERTNLPIILTITDEFGDAYPFDLQVVYDPTAAEQTSEALVSTFRPREKLSADD